MNDEKKRAVCDENFLSLVWSLCEKKKLLFFLHYTHIQNQYIASREEEENKFFRSRTMYTHQERRTIVYTRYSNSSTRTLSVRSPMLTLRTLNTDWRASYAQASLLYVTHDAIFPLSLSRKASSMSGIHRQYVYVCLCMCTNATDRAKY